MRFLYCFLFFYVSMLNATEYSYPVASLNNGAKVLYIHQHTPTNIELLEWNPNTNKTEQLLWSVFNPAGLQILPDNSGFSFIDNGRLRIKLFARRSPKAIDFDEPLFGLNGLQWITKDTCYCSAYYNDNFALFELHDDGTINCLRYKEGSDYLYPQKIGMRLFYIERCATKNTTHYQIMQSTYSNNNSTVIVDCGDSPIVFLTMVSDNHGFVLEHAQTIDSTNLTTSFLYHEIKKQGDKWTKNVLFSFAIPTNLLLEGEKRLYESLLPLLPRIVKNKVYFVDCDPTSPRLPLSLKLQRTRRRTSNNYYLEPYFYDLATKEIQKINLPTKNGHYFVPIQCGKKFCCGGTVLNSQKTIISF